MPNNFILGGGKKPPDFSFHLCGGNNQRSDSDHQYVVFFQSRLCVWKLSYYSSTEAVSLTMVLLQNCCKGDLSQHQ